MTIRWCALFTILILFGACGSNNSQLTNREEVRIGLYAPLTGNTASYGQTVKKGVDLAVEEANRAEKDKNFRLIVEDDRGNPEEAQSAVIHLITKYRVHAILGEASSSGSLAGAPICQQYGIPMITPTSTNPKVTQVGNCIFRVCWIDPFQGKAMADFAFSRLQLKRIAVLYDVTSDYSTGLTEVFDKAIKNYGGEIVKKLSYNAGDSDFQAQLTAIHGADVDALFLPGYYMDVGLIVRQARGLGITVPILGADGWDSPSLSNIAGPSLNNTYFCTHFFPEDPSPAVQNFVQKFRGKYREMPSAGSALGYDAMNLLRTAIHQAAYLAPRDIREAIASIRDFEGVTGQIRIDSSRNAVKPAVVLQFVEGKVKFVERIEPQ